MKKVKQILAILGIVLILGVNVLLVVTAGTTTEGDMGAFNAALVTVILVPVLLWIYLYIFKLMKKRSNEKDERYSQTNANHFADWREKNE